MEAVIIRGV